MANTNMTTDGNGAVVPQNQASASAGESLNSALGQDQTPQASDQNPLGFTDAQLLEMWKRWKKECFDQRWIFERQWMRNIWYLLNRQWIYFDSRRGQWQDKRLAKWIPRPVTNILLSGLHSVRANFAQINYGANGRPIGNDNLSVITADLVDDYAPILHEDHQMDFVMDEADFWLLACGNVWLHESINYDVANGQVEVPFETCAVCNQSTPSNLIAENKQRCPFCNNADASKFSPTLDENGDPVTEKQNLPKACTYALSPFEIAYPMMYARFEESPIVVRMRWRDQSYYENNPDLQQYVKGPDALAFSKVPQERTMQIFKTLPFQSDMGIAPPYFASGGANVDTEGVVEYDVWVKPCADFPDGAVIRIAGDAAPTIIHSKKENLPGPLPFTDGRGRPIFPFQHGRYEQTGGRSYGMGMLDPAIQKQDQLNQLDSHMLMTIGRMANPIWLEPKGAEVEKFTGEPGLVVKWNPLVAGGQAKPERIPGEGIPPSVFNYRELIKDEADELMGTKDPMKGGHPPGVEAYAALDLLVQRGQARHASAYKSRGRMYKGWFKVALELERAFGEEQRTRAVLSKTRGWAFQHFKKADLGGDIEIMIEDGTLTPKTQLGERAAIDHLAQIGLLNPNDPDQRVAIYQKFGQTSLMPSTDAQVQEAWMNTEKFEKFMKDPAAIAQATMEAQVAEAKATAAGQPLQMTFGPLQYRRWYDPQIHRNELIKWTLSDRGRAVFQDVKTGQQAMALIDQYLTTIDIAIGQAQMGILDANGIQIPITPGGGAGGPGPGAAAPAPGSVPGGLPQQQGAAGRGQQMRNSNQNAGGVEAASQLPAIAMARAQRATAYLEGK